MSRSVTTVLCVAVVWTAGLGDTAEAGLQPQEDRQRGITSVVTPAIPEIVGDYALIYKPQPDIYTGKGTEHYKAGQTYTNWQPNDHTFIKGPDNRLGTIIGTHTIIDRRDSRKSKERNAKIGCIPIRSEMKEYYPAFSWETVPVGFHFGKTASLITDEEAQFVASHASFVCLEKGHASRQFRYTEEGIDRESMQLPLERKREIAAQNITFPLAAFLVGAQENSYFIYSWGYRMKDGCLELYRELDKKLGAPLADARETGWVLERDFEHASVCVNLETKEANIDWHDSN